MKADSRDKDCFPEPPTPTNKALPRGASSIRFILQKLLNKIEILAAICLVI